MLFLESLNINDIQLKWLPTALISKETNSFNTPSLTLYIQNQPSNLTFKILDPYIIQRTEQ